MFHAIGLHSYASARRLLQLEHLQLFYLLNMHARIAFCNTFGHAAIQAMCSGSVRPRAMWPMQ